MTNNNLTTTDDNIMKALAKARREHSLEPIWNLPDVNKVIPALRPHDLYSLVTRVGIGDSLEFLSLATPSQICSAMDFDCWNRDEVNLAKYLDWISTLSMLGFEKLGDIVAKSDPELSALFLLKSAVVYNLKEVESPEFDHIPYYQTPDTFFEIYPREGTDENTWFMVTDLISNLYRYDQDLARSIIMDSMWGTELYLEEAAYKLMKGRIEDAGFYDYIEALSVYKWIDPTTVTLGSKILDPKGTGSLPISTVPPALFGDGPFFRAFSTLSDQERDRVTVSVVSLFNRMAAADRVMGDDDEGLSETAELAATCLDLGVTYIARNQEEHFATVVSEIASTRVFQVGYSLIHQLKGLALTLSRSGHISLSPRTSTLLEGPWAAFYNSLTKGHPRLNLAIMGEPKERFFHTLTDVATASSLIEDMSMLKGFLFNGLEISPTLLTEEGLVKTNKPHPGQVTLGDLFRTWLLAHLAGIHGPNLRALTFEQTEDGMEALKSFDAETLTQTLITAIEALLLKKQIRTPQNLPRIVRSFVTPLYTGQHPRHLIIRQKQ
ncbi:hypothetical protein KKF84_01785 [Myxococcota bacterium]|nr:hypothetical protein [Myxococcota bacterium]MBU1534016.1 hypothetical protein [Myxococcota bacterium]